MAIYSEFFPLKMVIFHSYVSLPEGTIWLGESPSIIQLWLRIAIPMWYHPLWGHLGFLHEASCSCPRQLPSSEIESQRKFRPWTCWIHDLHRHEELRNIGLHAIKNARFKQKNGDTPRIHSGLECFTGHHLLLQPDVGHHFSQFQSMSSWRRTKEANI